MDSDEKLFYLYYLYIKSKNRSRARKMWVYSLNLQRPIVRAFITLYQDLREDERTFFNYFRKLGYQSQVYLTEQQDERWHLINRRLAVILRNRYEFSH